MSKLRSLRGTMTAGIILFIGGAPAFAALRDDLGGRLLVCSGTVKIAFNDRSTQATA